LSDQFKEDKMGGPWGMHLVGKHEEKIPLGRYKNRWENNIKINLK